MVTDENKNSPVEQGSKNSERDGFFEFYRISKEEEEFFKMIYRRRQIYRWIIIALIVVIAVLLKLM